MWFSHLGVALEIARSWFQFFDWVPCCVLVQINSLPVAPSTQLARMNDPTMDWSSCPVEYVTHRTWGSNLMNVWPRKDLSSFFFGTSLSGTRLVTMRVPVGLGSTEQPDLEVNV